MGTSVRKTSAKIKKLLGEVMQDNPDVEYNDVIPQIAKETMRSKKTKNYFGNSDFEVIVRGGIACFNRASTVGYESFVREYGCDPQKITAVEVQKIIEAILDDIEQNDGDIQTSIILTAFKVTATELLLGKITEPLSYLGLFCQKFVEMIIREEASEELLSAFKDKEFLDLDASISSFAKQYVKEHFADCIEQCVRKETSVSELVSLLQKKLS